MYTRAVVADSQQLYTALLDIDLEPRCAGIKAVFKQLLHDRGRALDDLARRNLIGEALA